jgi:hypothetical protein
MKRLLVALSLALAASVTFALPTVEDVQAEVAKGRFVQAEEMMREVVAARPGSARAHYVYAEILAHDRRFEQAASELARARQIDPSDRYTDRARLDAFSALLEREQAAAHRQRDALRAQPGTGATVTPVVREAPVSQGIPGWAWGLGGGLLALAAWRMFGSRRQTLAGATGVSGSATGSGGAGAAAPYGASMAGGAPGYGPGYGQGYPAATTGAGSGLLGTGLAVAGGVAAGMLAERLFEGHRDSGNPGSLGSGGGGLGAGLGAGSIGPGLLEGEIEDPSARELQERPVDFGSGNGWGDDGGDASGGASDDGGW